ncbi:hypothetical protein [[Eubacterium] cellulosolvens]
MSNSLMRGFYSGLIAGCVGGIVGLIFGLIGSMIGLYELASIPITNILVSFMIFSIIFGGVWGLIYSRFYDSIPRVGITKGLFFGLMLWMLKDLMTGSYIAFSLGNIPIAITIIFGGFFLQAVYGLTIGILYKKK